MAKILAGLIVLIVLVVVALTVDLSTYKPKDSTELTAAFD